MRAHTRIGLAALVAAGLVTTTLGMLRAQQSGGVAIDPDDLTFVHVVHYRAPGSEGRLGFFFLTE